MDIKETIEPAENSRLEWHIQETIECMPKEKQ